MEQNEAIELLDVMQSCGYGKSITVTAMLKADGEEVEAYRYMVEKLREAGNIPRDSFQKMAARKKEKFEKIAEWARGPKSPMIVPRVPSVDRFEQQLAEAIGD